MSWSQVLVALAPASLYGEDRLTGWRRRRPGRDRDAAPGRVRHRIGPGRVPPGFLLFLAIPIDRSLPFGGLSVFGAVAALALWLYLALHPRYILVLAGLSTDLGLGDPML